MFAASWLTPTGADRPASKPTSCARLNGMLQSVIWDISARCYNTQEYATYVTYVESNGGLRAPLREIDTVNWSEWSRPVFSAFSTSDYGSRDVRDAN